jgi:dienelactone hydrolase
MKTETIEYKVGETNCKGYLAYDDAIEAKRPGVIVIHEWWGLSDYPKRRAEQLAQLGYVAFCADMFGEGKTTRDPKQAGKWANAIYEDSKLMADRFNGAVEQLKKQSRVDAQRIGAIGYCFGGGTVLNMARTGADLKGVVSFHGALGTQTPAKKGAIKSQVLVCHGADDSFDPPEGVLNFQKEMTDAGARWQLILYSGAQHAFTNPDADKFGIQGVAYNATADRRSWKAMQAFFDEVFGTAK